MTVRKIVSNTREVLHTPTEKVKLFDKKLGRLLDDLYDTMIAFDGIGIAAPQIGLGIAVAIVDIEDERGTIELINPRIL
ncbi:MAG: peptide deformylase, partial [Bacilli bacterium]